MASSWTKLTVQPQKHLVLYFTEAICCVWTPDKTEESENVIADQIN